MKQRIANKVLNNPHLYITEWVCGEQKLFLPKTPKHWYLLIKACSKLHKQWVIKKIAEQFNEIFKEESK